MSLEKLLITPNVPVQVALKFAGDGKLCKSQHGYADQVYFTLAQPAGHCIYTDLPVAAKIKALEPAAGELFWIQKKWTGQKGVAPEWDVWPANDGPVAPPSAPKPPALAAIEGGRDERTLAALEEARKEAHARLDEITRKQQAVALVSSPASVKPVCVKPEAEVVAAKPVGREVVAEPDCALVQHANLLIDAYAEVLLRALTKHQGKVKPDEVRSIFLTAVINMAGGKQRAA
jgi:hypothetical protein